MNLLQNLIHESLVATGHVECAAIIRRKDSSIRATSVGYTPSAEQIEAITAAFKNPPQAREHGIYFNGASYCCIRADKNSVYAKKAKSGFIAVRTTTLIIFGSYSSSMYPAVCVEAVEKLGEYFREKNK
ncbi:profilin-4-like [Dysidea avara]|uniref:profilin-4-like n=1 Tax=Dysidea avara TaxID=196820 RepID=UPI003318AD45